MRLDSDMLPMKFCYVRLSQRDNGFGIVMCVAKVFKVRLRRGRHVLAGLLAMIGGEGRGGRRRGHDARRGRKQERGGWV